MTFFAQGSARFYLLFFAAILLPLSVAAQATLSVVPTSVSVQTNVGTNAPSQTLQVTKSGSGAARWTVVQPAQPWVTVSPTSGTNNGALVLTFLTSGLAAQAQPYTTSFQVTTSTQSVTVNVAVTIVGSTGDWTFCASEGQFCAFSGTKQVRYGANNTFVVKTLSDGTPCTNAVFGDPIVGTAKHCDVGAPPPPPTLTITCPANITVPSPDGSPVVVTYAVTTSGGTPPVTLTVNPPSGSSFSVGTTTVQANAASTDGQKASCSFTVAITFSPPSGNWTFCATEGQLCAFSGTKQVRYGANNTFVVRTLSGGTPCTNQVFGDPIVGTVKHCDIDATVSPSGVGPQAAITCPAGAFLIAPNHPGDFIPSIINSHPPGTTFCLQAGMHALNRSITPRTGDTYVGEYGAILDGTGWTTANDTQAAFRVYDDPNDPNDPSADVDAVTIRNLVIRNMPQWGIHGFRLADHWTIEYNEIASNRWGLAFGPDSTIRNNYLHHNVGPNPSSPNPAERGGGYVGQFASNTTFDGNEIAYNGREQKVGNASANVTFRNNFVHHNVGDGIWFDFNTTNALIEGNRVEDNGRGGIAFEASNGATIRNNTLRRNAADAVLISMSQNAEIYNNVLEANFGGIEYFLNCAALAEGFDVQNNAAHDNTVVIGTQSNTYSNGFSYTFSLCTSAQVAPYLNRSKNLTFSRNAYRVPSLSDTKYFIWPSYTDWNAWQALGHDLDGSISQ